MLRYFRWALLIAAIPVSASLAADEAKTPPAKTTPSDVLALYHDGSKVRMIFLQENLEIETKYGKLKVPTADIRRIDFGFRLNEETTKKLDEALKHLVSDNFQLREQAAKTLTGMGRLSYPALVKMAKGMDLDTTRRVEDVIKAIRIKVPAEQLRSRMDDLVHTQSFTIAGKIEVGTIKAKTEHFGEVDLKVVDLRNIASTAGASELKISVDAATYGSGNVQWMDTGFTVQPDVQVVITASGEIDLYGNQGGGAFSGPEGNRNYGRGGQYLPGALIGRIGEEGAEVFTIGKRFEKVPNIEGKLYVRIAPLPGSGGATGTYSVQITAGNN